MQTQHDISTNIYERFIQLPEAGIYEETLDRIRINFLPEKYWGISNTILGTMLHRHGWRKDYFDADYWYSPTCLRLERDDFIEISGMVYRRYECDLNQETDAMINKIEQPGSVPTRRRFQPYTIEQLQSLPRVEYLIKKVLDRNSLSVMYGKSNCGKTFMALDMALHIALGWKWHGRKTRQGKVFYIAAEAGLGAKKRIEAFMQHHGLKGNPNFYFLPKGVNFGGVGKDVEEIIKEINIIGGVELVIIDTLNRALAGGDENSAVDMGAFVTNCDLIRHSTKATVLIVHHAGKDETKGGRGHSCLLGAIDTELAITAADGTVTAVITKQRDGEKDTRFNSDLTVVELGTDAEGESITSCVLIPTDALANQKEKPLTGRTKIAYEILCNLIAVEGKKIIPQRNMPEVMAVPFADFREALKTGDIADGDKGDKQKKAIQRAIAKLQDIGKIKVWNDYVWITGQGDK